MILTYLLTDLLHLLIPHQCVLLLLFLFGLFDALLRTVFKLLQLALIVTFHPLFLLDGYLLHIHHVGRVLLLEFSQLGGKLICIIFSIRLNTVHLLLKIIPQSFNLILMLFLCDVYLTLHLTLHQFNMGLVTLLHF